MWDGEGATWMAVVVDKVYIRHDSVISHRMISCVQRNLTSHYFLCPGLDGCPHELIFFAPVVDCCVIGMVFMFSYIYRTCTFLDGLPPPDSI